MSKKFILVIILALCFSMLIGCQKQPPEGVSQEFYDDMIEASEKLITSIKTAKNTDIVNGDIAKSTIDIMDKYISKTEELTIAERAIYESYFDLYYNITSHYGGNPKEEEIIESVEKFSKLMEIKIDIDKIIL